MEKERTAKRLLENRRKFEGTRKYVMVVVGNKNGLLGLKSPIQKMGKRYRKGV